MNLQACGNQAPEAADILAMYAMPLTVQEQHARFEQIMANGTRNQQAEEGKMTPPEPNFSQQEH